jgi:hypothetical protein
MNYSQVVFQLGNSLRRRLRTMWELSNRSGRSEMSGCWRARLVAMFKLRFWLSTAGGLLDVALHII